MPDGASAWVALCESDQVCKVSDVTPTTTPPVNLQPPRVNAPLVPVAATRPPRPGFLAGIRIFFQGAGMLIGTPRLYPLAMVPIAAAIVMISVFTWGSIAFLPSVIASLVSSNAWWSIGLQAVGTIAGVVIGFFLALALAQPVSGPALESLVRATEKHLGAPPRPPTGLVEDVVRGLGSALLSLSVGMPLFAILFLVNLIPGGSFIAVPLKFILAMLLIGWDLCDYPLSVRGSPIGDRVRFVAKNASAVLGFSAALAAIALLPCGALLILPAGVCGATRLLFEIERAERG
jgi:CysZ protein